MTSLDKAREVLKTEADAIMFVSQRLDDRFERAVALLQRVRGRIILTGMGKPGFIARKIAATMASTGSPSYYVHPAEALHGDLGMIQEEDVVVAISHSGETEEIVRIIPLVKKIGCPLIALTGRVDSTLAKNSDVVLDVSIKKEACPMGLAPTASSTAALAMGDALAIVLFESKGFGAKDYARLHPGGELGKKLLLKVKDVMRPLTQTPLAVEQDKVGDAVDMITKNKAGAVVVVDAHKKLRGIFTDGDLRREMRAMSDIMSKPLCDVMTANPFFVEQNHLAVEVLRLMKEKKIDEVPVVDASMVVVGLVDIQDLLQVGLL